MDNEWELIEEPKNENSTFKKIAKEVGKIGVRALQGPSNLLSIPKQVIDFAQSKGLKSDNFTLPNGQQLNPETPQIFKNIAEAPSQISSLIGKAFGGEENLKPSNILAESLQDVAGALPLIALTGGINPSNLVGNLGGALGSNAADQAGWGLGSQIGASVVGSKIAGSLGKQLSSALSNPGKIEQFKKMKYTQSQDLGSRFKTPTQGLDHSLENLEESIRREPITKYGWSEADKNGTLHNIKNTRSLLNTPEISGDKVEDLNRYVNSFYDQQNKFSVKANEIIKKEISKLSETHKDWGKAFKEANKINSIENWQSGFHDFLANKLDSKITRKALDTGIGKGAAVILSGAPIVADVAAEQLARPAMFLKELGSTKQGQRLLWDIALDSANKSSSSLQKDLTRLNKMASEWESINPDNEDEWQLVS